MKSRREQLEAETFRRLHNTCPHIDRLRDVQKVWENEVQDLICNIRSACKNNLLALQRLDDLLHSVARVQAATDAVFDSNKLARERLRKAWIDHICELSEGEVPK